MRKLNRRKRFAARPWELRYRRKVEPRLKRRALAIVNGLWEQGVIRRFQEYLKAAYPQFQNATLDREADKRALDRLANGFDVKGLSLDEVNDIIGAEVFKAGSEHAFRKLGVKLSWNLDSPAALAALDKRANKLADVDDAQFKAVKDLIRTRLYEQGGKALDNGFLDALRKEAGRASLYDAERIARTEVASLQGAASNTVYRENGVTGKGWIATIDDRTRESHAEMNGEEVGIDEPFSNGLMFPGDPDGPAEEVCNCVIGSTAIAAAEVQRLYSREYSGELITIETASGNQLSVTPNHPILTRRGWIAAGKLNELDYVVADGSFDYSLPPGVAVDVKQPPTQIKQVFHTLLDTRNSHRKGGSVVDFHGDGQDGDVEIVLTDGELHIGGITPLSEPFRQIALEYADLALMEASPDGLTRHFRLALGHGPAGIVGRACSGTPSLRGHSGSADQISFTPRAGSQTAVMEPRIDRATAEIEMPGKSEGGIPGVITLDQIVKINRLPDWHGRVFNLQTASSIYIANGIITHNCRCDYYPIMDADYALDPDEAVTE